MKRKAKGNGGRDRASQCDPAGARKPHRRAQHDRHGRAIQAVYGRSWRNRINDTRPLRKIITDLQGRASRSIRSLGQRRRLLLRRGRRELAGYLRRNKVRALKILKINAQIMKISMPDYLGQMKLDMEGGHDEAA